MSNKTAAEQDAAERGGTDERQTPAMSAHMQDLDDTAEAASEEGSSGNGGTKAGGSKSKSGEHSSGRSGDSKGNNRS